ncbi:dienelactone hydrolase family protein [Actinomadura rugatobispora]|uniref:Dienelactone hydrolase family protein n=1 Tax=Actinomadura rugatobispora TaxID=1994 RepID=A0ABW1AIN4_9ACTN|nr:dienelactone hydrolase family protein [Actinomadura rugatobispora]
MTGVQVPVGDVLLEGDLVEPSGSRGMIVFAHGSGSGRHSPRNRQVAIALNAEGFGTLLFDLLTVDEETEDRRTARLRFDVPLLAGRLGEVVAWVRAEGPVGLFGASTGAAAALVAAAASAESVGAVVSRGGRPDLAARALEEVRAPTLLIVGGRDLEVLSLNERALEGMDQSVGHRLTVVPGAGHLFEEPGALEEVARLSAEWFSANLREWPAP